VSLDLCVAVLARLTVVDEAIGTLPGALATGALVLAKHTLQLTVPRHDEDTFQTL
jgi:hypothetical protein